jgi:hypothetical protein
VPHIAAATAELAQLISTESGRAALSSQFNTCTPLTDDPSLTATLPLPLHCGVLQSTHLLPFLAAV